MSAWRVRIALLAIVSYPHISRAQQVSPAEAVGSLRVAVRSADGSPARGALLAIVDRAGQVVAEALTNSAGERSFPVAAGSYRARILRIGFAPTWSDWISVSGETRLDVALSDARVNLDALVVRTRTACTRTEQDTEGAGLVWAEITKALRSSQLTITDSDSLARAKVYRKLADAEGWIISADTTWVPVRDRQPFSAVDPALLARNGYVRGSVVKGFEFFGPDEKVLLSNEFAATHCFRLVRDPSRQGVVGVAFEPVPGRRIADIAGTIWVDDETSELKEITFSYVRAGIPAGVDAGGFTQFQRVASGGWIISKWQMRMPRLEISRVPYGYGFPDREITSLVGRMEFGGGVEVRESSARTKRRPMSRVTGIAFDSVELRPLNGASVELAGSAGVTDEAGEFVFEGVPHGNHVLKLSHPYFADLGYAGLEREIHIAGDSLSVPLSTPSARRTWERICRNVEFEERRWRGIVHGVVRDAEGSPVADAVVRFNWQIIPRPTGPSATPRADMVSKRLDVTTDAAGRYSACGFLPGSAGTISVLRSGMDLPLERFAMTASRVLRVDLRR